MRSKVNKKILIGQKNKKCESSRTKLTTRTIQSRYNEYQQYWKDNVVRASWMCLMGTRGVGFGGGQDSSG